MVLLILGPLTAWNLTTTEALAGARTAYQHHDELNALRLSLDHLDVWPWSREASKIAALSLSKLGFPREAEPYYKRAGTLDPEEVRARAFGLLRADLIDQALAQYQEFLRHKPRDVPTLRTLGGLYVRLSRWNDALEVAERLIQTPGGATIGYTLQAQVLYFIEPDSPERAIKAFEKVLELDPDLKEMPLPHPQFWSELAQLYMNQGKPGKARESLLRALNEKGESPTSDRDNASLMEQLGEAYRQEGSTEEAMDCWRQARDWDPNLPTPWLNLGRAELQQRHLQEAVQHLKRAAELMPGQPEPLYSLAQAYEQLGKKEEAARIRKLQGESRLRRPPAPSSGMGAPPSSGPPS